MEAGGGLRRVAEGRSGGTERSGVPERSPGATLRNPEPPGTHRKDEKRREVQTDVQMSSTNVGRSQTEADNLVAVSGQRIFWSGIPAFRARIFVEMSTELRTFGGVEAAGTGPQGVLEAPLERRPTGGQWKQPTQCHDR